MEGGFTMNVIKIAYARTFQFFLRIASKIVRLAIAFYPLSFEYYK